MPAPKPPEFRRRALDLIAAGEPVARVAKDLDGIEREVKRWQDAIGVHWTDDEINEVSRYLNRTYYLY